MAELQQLLSLEYGAALAEGNRSGHGHAVFGSNGEVGRHNAALVHEPGIVVGRKGSVGKVTWSDGPFWPIDTAYWVRCKQNDRRWLYWLLSHLPLAQLDSSTGVPGLNRNDVYRLEVFEPTDCEKRAIAQVLDTLDTAIRQTEAVIAKLKLVKQGLLHDLLTRGIDANGELRPPQSRAPHLYKSSPLGWIPTEWEVKPIRAICALGRGRVISQFDLERNPGPYPVYSSQTKDDGVFGYIGTFDFNGPHVTWTTDGANAGTVFYRDGRFNCTNVCGTLRALGPDIELRYVALALSGVTSKFVSRVGNDKLMNNVVAEIAIALPSPTEQHTISAQLRAIAVRTDAEYWKLGKLGELKSGLMDDLLTGRVRVTPLLEEIRP